MFNVITHVNIIRRINELFALDIKYSGKPKGDYEIDLWDLYHNIRKIYHYSFLVLMMLIITEGYITYLTTGYFYMKTIFIVLNVYNIWSITLYVVYFSNPEYCLDYRDIAS